MNPTIPDDMAASARSRSIVIALGAVAGLLAAGTVALWANYGTAVFYETIIAGINACF
jgi:hypothetical protein